MTTIEERIDNLIAHEFSVAADFTAMMVERHGFCYATLSPGDGTRYEISIVSPPTHEQQRRHGRVDTEGWQFSGSYFVATNFGRMYRWEGTEIGDWTYVYEKWTNRGKGTDEWTARVLHRFLNELAPLLAKFDTPPMK